MKNLVKSAEKFGRLIARLWPVWLPWLVVLAWPFARPSARAQIFGSPLPHTDFISLDEVWGELILGGYQTIDNPLPDGSSQPADLDLQVWEWNWNRSRSEVGLKSQKLVARFPDELVVYALEIRGLGLDSQINSQNTAKTAEIARLQTLARKAAQLEPDNAYWWIQLATAQELSGKPQAALQLLGRAALCKSYDAKERELARRSLAAFAPRRALAWEEKRAVYQMSRIENDGKNARAWGNRARYLAKNGNARDALNWSAALANVGDVMVGADAFAVGRIWQDEAWSIGTTPGAPLDTSNTSEPFALYATRNGRPELAKTTRAQAARVRSTEALLKTARTGALWLDIDDLDATLRAAQIGGVALIGVAAYLALWWMAANIFNWRAVGEASPRRTRVAISGFVAGALLVVAALASWWFWRDNNRPLVPVRSAQQETYEALCISLNIFAFIAAPWLLALAIAGATMWRGRAQFALPPRVDLELQLSPGARRLLRWALPFVVAGSAFLLFVGWSLAVLGLWFGWKGVNVLGWLPPDRNGKTGSLITNFANEPWILAYGMMLCAVCLVGWFAKWRWGTPQRLRPLTHGALRAWKESLGCAISWVLWAYLLVLVLSVPARARAEARLDAVLQRGEIAVLRDLSWRN